LYDFPRFVYESTMTVATGSERTPNAPLPAVARRVQVERIAGGLHGMRWRPGLPPGGGPARLALLVEAGQVALRHGGALLQAEGPVLLWSDWPAGTVLAAAPGAAATALTMAEDLLQEAIGLTLDTDHLRALLRPGPPLVLALDANRRDGLQRRLQAIDAELRERGDGFHTALSAHLVLLAVALWRRLNAEGLTRPGAGGRHAVLDRFRRLLELHYRERWRVGDYAAELDLPARRLNRICSRHLGRSPTRLIDQRSLREARLRLERSGLTVAQIAHELGFVDPPHFSRFFKAQTGLTPGAWRAGLGRRDGADAAPAGFSDWP